MADTAAVTQAADVWQAKVGRDLKAPLSQVWRAFADPVRLAQWFGPEGLSTEIHAMDFRPGGAYSLTMHHDDGRDFPLKGTILDIVEGERIVMSWLWLMADATGIETRVSFDFTVIEGGTRLDITHERFADADNAAGHGEGWTSSLKKFDSWLATDD